MQFALLVRSAGKSGRSLRALLAGAASTGLTVMAVAPSFGAQPPPSAVGVVTPLVSATARVAPPGYVQQAASYIAQQAIQDLPAAVLKGNPDLSNASAVADRTGPVAMLIPSTGLTPDLLVNPPAGGKIAGWLLLRYGTPLSPDGPVPADRVASLVFPGPFRMTFLPLQAAHGADGKPVLNVMSREGAPLFSLPILSNTSPSTALTLGPSAADGKRRTVTILLPGSGATLEVGPPTPAEILPRPMEGDLKVGDEAPDFTLPSASGLQTTTLSAFRYKQPVVLVFGSYT